VPHPCSRRCHPRTQKGYARELIDELKNTGVERLNFAELKQLK
jgi:hypothetical protein